MAQVGDTVMVLMSYPDNFSIVWDGREYKLERDVEKFVPFEVAANYFGDPRAVGAMQATQDHRRRYGWVPDRPAEVRRLRVLYGVQHGDEASVYLPDGLTDRLPNTGDWPERIRHWHEINKRIPRVQVYDLEDRQRLYTVLEDPLGEHVTPALVTVSNEAKLQSRVDRLEDLVRTLTKGQGLVTPEGIVAPDPDAKARVPSAAEQAMQMARGDGSDSESSGDDDSLLGPSPQDLITSERSGAAGLPADRG